MKPETADSGASAASAAPRQIHRGWEGSFNPDRFQFKTFNTYRLIINTSFIFTPTIKLAVVSTIIIIIIIITIIIIIIIIIAIINIAAVKSTISCIIITYPHRCLVLEHHPSQCCRCTLNITSTRQTEKKQRCHAGTFSEQRGIAWIPSFSQAGLLYQLF